MHGSKNVKFLESCTVIRLLLCAEKTPKVERRQRQERPSYRTFWTTLQLVWFVNASDHGKFLSVFSEKKFLSQGLEHMPFALCVCRP